MAPRVTDFLYVGANIYSGGVEASALPNPHSVDQAETFGLGSLKMIKQPCVLTLITQPNEDGQPSLAFQRLKTAVMKPS